MTFKTVQGNKFEMDLDSSDKVCNVAAHHIMTPGRGVNMGGVHAQVADVKQKIESSQGPDFPVSQQVVIYQGKVRCHLNMFTPVRVTRSHPDMCWHYLGRCSGTKPPWRTMI